MNCWISKRKWHWLLCTEQRELSSYENRDKELHNWVNKVLIISDNKVLKSWPEISTYGDDAMNPAPPNLHGKENKDTNPNPALQHFKVWVGDDPKVSPTKIWTVGNQPRTRCTCSPWQYYDTIWVQSWNNELFETTKSTTPNHLSPWFSGRHILKLRTSLDLNLKVHIQHSHSPSHLNLGSHLQYWHVWS